MGKKTAAVFIIGCIITLIAYRFVALAADSTNDAPHNQDYSISCASCHISEEFTDPDWADLYDDTCLGCHKASSGPYSDTNAPRVKTHSSENTSYQHGSWTKQCRDCHNPHRQAQKNYTSDTYYLASGTITGTDDYSSGTNTTVLHYSSITFRSGWDASKLADKTAKGGNDKRGAVLIPNTTNSTTSKYTYLVKSADSSTITVIGNAKTQNPTNTPFKVIYGQLIKDTINSRPVKFFDRTETNSFADGDGTRDGVCEVCHTDTTHFRNDGNGSDQLHTNMGEVAGTACTDCHAHDNGFMHGAGSIGVGCVQCHGHDAGTYYDLDTTLPYNPGANQSQGRGTHQSHSTHTESISSISPSSAGDDDRKGPGIYCADCHDITKFPLFKDGKSLAETTVCNPCHSEGGTYKGVSDPVIGAKVNWKSGIYEADSKTLQAGKEKWCAGCHDEVPGNSKPDGSGMNAPNVIGDEGGSFTYGTGWGFYKTGHGLPSNETYPASGGISSGVGATCDACHDLATKHIDGFARTFDDDNDTSGTDRSEQYRQGYRLKMINGQEPMVIPKTGRSEADNYRLCVSCHTNTAAFTDPNSTQTNFRDTTNRHYYHLDLHDLYRWSADWDFGAYTSRITCVSCHNVHGSTRLAMIRDGKLVNREPGIQIWYYNSGISTNTNPPFPPDLPLSASTGLLWLPGSSGNICYACHGGTSTEIFGPRTPFQPTAQAPVLDWTGENGYVSDGAAPDSAASGSTFTFRVKYTDYNNDAPHASTGVQLWIDANNDGTYESTYAMTGINDADNTYVNGKIYSKTITLTNAGGNIINYRFHAKDANGTEATGPATGVSSVTLTTLALNNPPSLDWVSGSCRFEGVSPLAQVSGSVFDFRVKYTDANNNAPTTKQVWVDLNDDGDYDDADEKQDMTLVGGDGDYRNGEIFTKSLNLNFAGDGKINYRFVFSDGTYTATGDPSTDHKVTVINSAATRKTVCASGCDYSTIQSAVNAISSGQMVLVSSGTYSERVTFDGNDNNKTVRSVCGPDDTVIDASGAVTYGVEVTGSTGSVVDGFGIANGTIGVYLHHSSASTNITIENCKIHDNAGGGVYSGDTSSITVNNSEVYSNTAGTGAGLYLKEGVNFINNTIIRNNHASMNGGGVGTGLWNSTTFTNTTIKGNTADGSGGGFAQTSDSSTATFYQSTILDNTATTGSGGGLYIQGEGGTYGVSLTNSVVSDNQASSGGGIWQDGNLSAINCTIANNRATGATGGGGAIYANTGGSVTVRNSILWNNAAPAVGSRHIAYLSSSTPTTISDSILNNDGGTTFNRYPYFVVQDGGSLPTISGFVSGADPFFVDAANRDYHIQSTSPAIDHASATYAPDDDIDGDSRHQNAPDDIGADEYKSSTANSAPVLAWTGEANYTVDGVNPDSGDNGSSFTFHVHYDDAGGGSPAVIQLWLDRNDDAAYEASEKYDMSSAGNGIYTITIGSLTAAGDGHLNYRFYASDGINDSVGEPTNNSAVTVNAPTVTFTTASQATAGESGTATITVQLSSAGSEDVTVPFTVNGNSTATGGGVDYSITPSPVTIPAGSTTSTITVSISSDTLDEDNETVIVDMGSPINAVKGTTTTHALTITDDDPIPTVTFTSASQSTANESGTATITAQLSAASGRDVTVPFTVNSGSTATGGGIDYSITASPITIPAGSTTANISVSITSDALDEDNETVIVDMGTPTNATMGAVTSHTLTITDDDPTPTVTFTSASQTTTLESGSYTITAQLSAVSGRTVTMPFTVNGSSTAEGGGVDYSITASPLTIPAGSTNADITVTITNDSLVEGNETVIVDMGTPINATQGAVTTHTLTIRDDDGAQISVCSTLSAPFNKIQTTIADAGTTNGSTLLVCAGTYPEKVNFLGKNITVKAESGASVTFITGDNTNNPVVTFSSGEISTAVLDGFTIDNQAAASTATRGIYISASSAPTIKNCVVEGNTMSGGQNGSGIYINGGTATIQNTTIGGDASNKNSCQSGCGLYATAISGPLSISNSTISENTGTGIGAGVWLVSNGTQVTTITNTTFTNNTATLSGGAIYNNASILSISGTSSFTSNTAGTNQNGGAIYNTGAGASVSIDGVTFTTNSSGNLGGAIYMTGSTAAAPLSISNSTFTGNTATAYGGAIALATITNATTISSTTISGSSTSNNKGGAIYALSAPLTLTSTNVNNNTAGLEGGGIYATGITSVLSITGGSVSGNSGTVGGGIYLTDSASLTATDITISNNTARSTFGGGIYSSTLVTVENGIFEDNTATLSGGAIYANLGFNITGCTFIGNQGTTGGAIFNQGANGNFYGSNTFTGNVATGSGGNAGGAIFSNARVININDAGSVFSGNYGTGSGGAVWVSAAFNVNGATTFDSNGSSTVTSGGAVLCQGGTINDSTFTNNRAAGSGGALFFVSTAGTVNRSTFSGNYLTSASNGGAFYSNVSSNSFNNSTFYNNSAGPSGSGTGGALYTSNGWININYCSFYDNKATTATAIRMNTATGIKNSIVANSTGSTTLCVNVNDGGSNLQYNGTCVATFTTADPMLSALANNGGPTQTMALQAGSPAIDTGTTGTCLPTDQRGVARPVNGGISLSCDKGSFEYVPQ